MKIYDLQQLIDSSEFHHATYREIGKLWEGLWVYKKSNWSRGFDVAGCFYKDSEDLEKAYELLRAIKHGISVGSYGQG
jgi:hypothetical protein